MSSVHMLLEKWDAISAHWRALAEGRKRSGALDGGYICQQRADGYAICAQHLRAEMAAATERQPEENVADDLRPHLPGVQITKTAKGGR